MDRGEMDGGAMEADEKGGRRARILEAARALMESGAGATASVPEVARRAGVARGTVLRHFRAKEDIHLQLLGDQIEEWLDHVRDEAAALGPDLKVEDVVRSLRGYIAGRPAFMWLLSISHTELEPKASPEAALAHKRRVARRLRELGAMLEAAFPNLEPGAGSRLLAQSYAYILGLWQLANPPEPIRAMLQDDGLRNLRLDFKLEAEDGLYALWRAAAGG